jgi:hypothetical protein
VAKKRGSRIGDQIYEAMVDPQPWPNSDTEKPNHVIAMDRHYLYGDPSDRYKAPKPTSHNPATHNPTTHNQTRNPATLKPTPNQARGNAPPFNPPGQAHVLVDEDKVVHEDPIIDEKTVTASLINLTKMYTDEQKYGGEMDSFVFKYNVFKDMCARAGIHDTLYVRAFPTMLKGTALNHYFTCILDPTINTIAKMSQAIQSHFKGPEYQRNNLTKWNDITLKKTATKHPNKSIEDCLQTMVHELRTMQLGLHKDLRNETFLLHKLITACQDHPACSLAYAKPADTASGMISNLRSSIVTYEKVHEPSTLSQFTAENDGGDDDDERFFTDRRYYSNRQNRYNNNNRDNYNSYSNRGRDRPYNNPRLRPPDRKCFVCRKSGCWSTKHTPKEKDEAKAVQVTDKPKIKLELQSQL